MLVAYEAQGCKMSLKVHFLHSHTDCFPENLGAYSEEQGERFLQGVRVIERLYQGRWDVNMLAGYTAQAGSKGWKAKACSEKHQRGEEKVSQTKRVNL